MDDVHKKCKYLVHLPYTSKPFSGNPFSCTINVHLLLNECTLATIYNFMSVLSTHLASSSCSHKQEDVKKLTYMDSKSYVFKNMCINAFYIYILSIQVSIMMSKFSRQASRKRENMVLP